MIASRSGNPDDRLGYFTPQIDGFEPRLRLACVLNLYPTHAGQETGTFERSTSRSLVATADNACTARGLAAGSRAEKRTLSFVLQVIDGVLSLDRPLG